MQQISETQRRLQQRKGQRKQKFKYNSLDQYNNSRGKSNPQSSNNKSFATPGKLYLQSLDQYKQRNYYTIDTDMQRLDTLQSQEYTKLKGFAKLPQIKSRIKVVNSEKRENNQRKRYQGYRNPTINSELYSEGNKKDSRNNEHKRICSVHCHHRDEKPKKKKVPKQEYRAKQFKSTQNTEVKDYLTTQSKARYPTSQLKNYLSQMKLKEAESKKKIKVQDQYDDSRYYQTYFGLQPEFYKLQTEYALEFYEPRKIEHHFTEYNHATLPEIPHKQDIADYIQNYRCVGKEIDIDKLIKKPNFLVEYTPSQMYFGEMNGHMREGLGVVITRSSCFEGLFKNNNKHKGSELNLSGLYKGDFKNEKKEGTGEFTWINGEYYIGDWVDGHRHGSGIWTNKNGDSYNGQWVKGRSEGTGIYITEGRQYRGDFVDFKKDGWGRQKLANEDSYEGGFKNGIPSGKGIYTWANGTKYEGEFMNGLRNGKGLLSTMDGFVYHGQFIDEKPEGLCEIFMPNGDVYQGYLRNGKKNGRGVLMLKQSKQNLDGYWQNDLFINSIKR